MTSKYRLPDRIGEGNRNIDLFRYACSLRAYGNEQDAILQALQIVNKERCTPPLSDLELKSIAGSAAKKDAGFSPEYQKRREEEIAKPDNLDFSDVGNANAFIRINKDDLLYTASRGWHVWTGTRYQQGDHLAMGRAIDYTDIMLQEALKEYRDATTAGDENAAKSAQAYLKYAKASRRVRNIKSMLEAAQVHYHAEASRLDSDPFILNTPWGMVDLHTGHYLAHDRAERCTLSTPDHKYPSVEAEEEAGGAQLWRDFLILVTNGDIEYMNYLQVVIGSSLIGKPLVEGLYIVYGNGRNGKSTFFKALQLALGDDYTGNINADVFTAGYNRDRENAMTPLIGKRLVCCGELEEGTTLSTSTTKRIASTDDLVVRRLYADRETVKPTHHVFLFTNHLPKVNTTDHGTWRRIHILPFDATMPEGDKDIPDYGSYLAEEAGETILQWCIDGAVKFVQAGCHLPPCTAVNMASTSYQADEDTTAQFLADRIEITGNPNDKIPSKDLFNAINNYAADNNKRGKTFSVLNKELENHGLNFVAESRRVNWIGIKWKTQQ
jgi:putative DNA primase/helicase